MSDFSLRLMRSGQSSVSRDCRANQAVHVTLPNGVTRTAKYLGSQGCVTLPFGEGAVHFTPVAVTSQLPDSAIEPWPMGDVLPTEALPVEIEATKLKAAVEAAFEPPEAGFRRHGRSLD
jgi:hypothetical protein